MAERETLPGLRRGVVLLEQLALKSDGMTFNEIKELFPEAPASTVSRLLKTLIEMELVCKNDDARNYRVGKRARSLGAKLCSKVSRAELLRPVVKELAEATKQSAAYFELVDDTNTLVTKHEIPEAFHYMDEGSNNINFDHHGCAKILMAYQNSETFERIWQRYLSGSDWSKTDYQQELENIRRDWVLINLRDDKSYMSRVAAPVFVGDDFAGAIGITLLGEHDTNMYKAVADAVKKAAARASQILTQY